jgi:hypothetical protein
LKSIQRQPSDDP